MDKVRKLSNSVCYTQSSEPYRIYLQKDLTNQLWRETELNALFIRGGGG
jgi:hypothetical protein